jgi:hypothetical protein
MSGAGKGPSTAGRIRLEWWKCPKCGHRGRYSNWQKADRQAKGECHDCEREHEKQFTEADEDGE